VAVQGLAGAVVIIQAVGGGNSFFDTDFEHNS
jgi:hypothetical protein